jgi:hypothetical protein
MSDVVLLALVLAAATSGGLAALRALGALPEATGERLLPGLAVGLGLTGLVGVGLAALGALRPLPIAAAGAVALAVGGRELVRAVGAVDFAAVRRAWPYLAIGAVVLATEAITMLAPPVGGDQTKYQLAYPRLFAAAGRLLPTPWCVWGQMQLLQNFVFAVGFALSGDVLARFLNATAGVTAALALAALVRHHLAPAASRLAGLLVFTLPIMWSLMTRAGSDLPVVLYAALGMDALLAWRTSGRAGDVRRAGLMAGLAGGTKVLALLVPALLGIALLVWLARRAESFRGALPTAVAFGLIALVAIVPFYLRSTIDTGNPIFPFGYGVFGGKNWNAAASAYLDEYYLQYQTTYASRRDAGPYAGLAVVRFPWDLTMHPESFENAARSSLDVSPFLLAFAPALLLVTRRRAAVLTVAAVGLAYMSIVSTGAWAHPRYVYPGVALAVAASVPAAWALLGPRFAAVLVGLTIAGNLALTSRLLMPMFPDQLRVAVGRQAPATFLRRWSTRYAFWERANPVVPAEGRVMVLEKVPHPYYIERPFLLASYLEQGLIDYRRVDTPEALAAKARELGVTHVAVDLGALTAAGDPYEASVARLWSAFVAGECDVMLRSGTYALYALRPETAYAAVNSGSHG